MALKLKSMKILCKDEVYCQEVLVVRFWLFIEASVLTFFDDYSNLRDFYQDFVTEKAEILRFQGGFQFVKLFFKSQKRPVEQYFSKFQGGKKIQ